MTDEFEPREWIDRVMPWLVGLVVIGTLCFFLSGLIYSLWMAYTSEVIEVLKSMKDIANPNAPTKDKWEGLIPFLLIVGLLATCIAVFGSRFRHRS